MKNVKMIKNNKGIFEMSIGQVVDSFEPMVLKFVRECNFEINTFEYDKDDYYQFGMETVCEAFKDYDINKGSFSTFLTYQLMGRKTKIKDWLFAEKRGSGGLNYYSLNDETDKENTEKMDKFLTCDESGFSEFVDMSIFEGLTKNELSLIPVLIKDITITEYSANNNISRPTAHKRLKEVKEKIREILIKDNIAYTL